jgi:hypothetical protein
MYCDGEQPASGRLPAAAAQPQQPAAAGRGSLGGAAEALAALLWSAQAY